MNFVFHYLSFHSSGGHDYVNNSIHLHLAEHNYLISHEQARQPGIASYNKEVLVREGKEVGVFNGCRLQLSEHDLLFMAKGYRVNL